MKYFIIIGITIMALIYFAVAAKYATKSNYPRDYIKVWISAGIAAIAMLSLFFV